MVDNNDKLKITAKRALSLLDLTLLGDNDDAAAVSTLCAKAATKYGNVAAICVWPKFVGLVKSLLPADDIKIAAVANFPHGSTDIKRAIADCEEIITAGGNEVDVVFPYASWIEGNRELAPWLVNECKKICDGKASLKVILETGALKTTELIHSASMAAIDAGANFIKTSTGKTDISATIYAAKIMLNAIKKNGVNCGFKASGGIKNINDAMLYMNLADEIMGDDWLSPEKFRFGASSLLDDLLSIINDNDKIIITNNGY